MNIAVVIARSCDWGPAGYSRSLSAHRVEYSDAMIYIVTIDISVQYRYIESYRIDHRFFRCVYMPNFRSLGSNFISLNSIAGNKEIVILDTEIALHEPKQYN